MKQIEAGQSTQQAALANWSHEKLESTIRNAHDHESSQRARATFHGVSEGNVRDAILGPRSRETQIARQKLPRVRNRMLQADYQETEPLPSRLKCVGSVSASNPPTQRNSASYSCRYCRVAPKPAKRHSNEPSGVRTDPQTH